MKLKTFLTAIILVFENTAYTNVDSSHSMSQFASFADRAQKGDSLNVVFLGGSLTWGAQATDPQRTSYRALVSRWLKDKYPRARFEIWDSAIGGTGSQLGAFRMERDVLAHKPDLVFLDFTVNDAPYEALDPDRMASYESLVRRMVQASIPIVQVLLPAKKDVLPNPPIRPLDSKHREIGEAYGLAIADAVALVKARVADGSVTPDQLWDVPTDPTHPGDAGYELYAESAWIALQQAIHQKAKCHVPSSMLNGDTYMTVNRFKLASLPSLPKGWSVDHPNRSAAAFDFTPSRWMGNVVVARRTKDEPNTLEPLVLSFQGNNVFLFGEATPESGTCRVLLDGKEIKSRDLGAYAVHGIWRYFEMLALNLDPHALHRLEVIPDLKPGQELRLESLCVAGTPAKVNPSDPF